MGKILVTGANGNIAGVALNHMVSTGADIRALVRDQNKAEDLPAMGIEVLVGDMGKPQTLEGVFDGVEKVLLITPVSPEAVEFGKNVISAAKMAGNPHVVMVTANVPEPVNETEVGRQRTEIETVLKDSGLKYTIIRPTFFMQNTMMAIQTVAADGMIYMPCREGSFGMIDLRDVGEAVATVMTTEGHEGKTYTLTGPNSISINDIADDLSLVLEKDVSYISVPIEAAKDAMVGIGMPSWLADYYNELFENFSYNGANFATEDFENITGRSATSYRQFAQDFAGAFKG